MVSCTKNTRRNHRIEKFHFVSSYSYVCLYEWYITSTFTRNCFRLLRCLMFLGERVANTTTFGTFSSLYIKIIFTTYFLAHVSSGQLFSATPPFQSMMVWSGGNHNDMTCHAPLAFPERIASGQLYHKPTQTMPH